MVKRRKEKEKGKERTLCLWRNPACEHARLEKDIGGRPWIAVCRCEEECEYQQEVKK
jgi:hypothetical protein